MKNKENESLTVYEMSKIQEAIALNPDEVRKDYFSLTLRDFYKKYECSSKTASSIFGLKSGGESKERGSRYEKKPHMKPGLNQFKWEYKEDNDYWKQDGFEIVEPTYMKFKHMKPSV